MTVTGVPKAGSDRRQIEFVPIPPYASPCVDYFAYSSACSCLGVTAAVVTDSAVVSSDLRSLLVCIWCFCLEMLMGAVDY